MPHFRLDPRIRTAPQTGSGRDIALVNARRQCDPEYDLMLRRKSAINGGSATRMKPPVSLAPVGGPRDA